MNSMKWYNSLLFILVSVLLLSTSTAQTANYVQGPDEVFSWEAPGAMLYSVEGASVKDNKYAYLADATNGLWILDISDFDDPEVVGPMEFDKMISNVYIRDDTLFLGGSSKLFILDITDPMNPVSLANITTPSTVQQVVVDDEYVYIACHSASLMKANYSALLHDKIAVANNYWTGGVVVDGDLAYTATSSAGFVVWDVSDDTPVIKSELKLGDNVYEIAQLDETTLVVGGRAGYIATVDVADPDHPVLEEILDITSDINGLEVYKDVVIAADYTDGIVSLLTHPLDFNTIMTSGKRGYGVSIDDKYIYGSLAGAGFYIWDIEEAVSNAATDPLPFHPELLLLILPLSMYRRRT
ncbi:MAG: hypothetical protein INQ03_09710 [Candidatus Heimdallarchaeota archaeon]|nr:hypothetical protein [Candidatus Heimdallarchaeota archaeon]